MRAFGIGEGDEANSVERISRDLLSVADENPSVALRLAVGALIMAERRVGVREGLISRGYVRRALVEVDA